jgi:hypothetical protein
MCTFICYILLLKSNLERYQTEIQLDINQDENGDIISTNKQNTTRSFNKLQESKDYSRTAQLNPIQETGKTSIAQQANRAIQYEKIKEANRREADYGIQGVNVALGNGDDIILPPDVSQTSSVQNTQLARGQQQETQARDKAAYDRTQQLRINEDIQRRRQVNTQANQQRTLDQQRLQQEINR